MASCKCIASTSTPCQIRGTAQRRPAGLSAIPLVARPTSLVSKRSARFVVRAEAEEPASTSPDVDALVKDLTDKWDKVDNKSNIIVYGVGAVAFLWLTSSIVGAVNTIPLLPKFLELVGFTYSAWFVYRYLLFKSSREELIKDVEDLKKKISGDD